MKKYFIITFLISMIPVVELRGAIPYAAYHGLPFGWSYALAAVGNLLPVPFILWFVPALFSFMRRHHILVGLVDWLERKAQKGAQKISKQKAEADGSTANKAPLTESVETEGVVASETKGKAIGTLAAFGLYLFVAIPLPGTGAWTGSLVAALFGMKRRRALPAIILGVLTAGVIMTLASYGVVEAFKFFAK